MTTSTLRVAGTRALTDRVLELVLESSDRDVLPAWSPGAHIELVLPSGLRRQYSLVANDDPRQYVIAVLREDAGRGGSLEIHRLARPGLELEFSGPRNNFELHDAPSYVFVAGGIGVTPLIGMIRAAAASGKEWTLVYRGHARASMVYVDLLRREFDDERVHIVATDTHGSRDVGELLGDQPASAAVYCCGPERLLDAAAAAARSRGLEFRCERFNAPEAAPSTDGDDHPFTVVLQRTGVELHVPADRFLIDVIRDAIPSTPFSCEAGFCGTCETKVLAGEPDHRDLIWTEGERAGLTSMMICVGRCRGPRLVLDL